MATLRLSLLSKLLVTSKLLHLENYVHPTGGWTYYFCFFRRPASALCHAWFPVISRKSMYPIFTKFGVGVYWVNSLHGIAFGEDNSIANRVIATYLLLCTSFVSGHFKEKYLTYLYQILPAILNFQIFANNAKTQICFYLLNRAR